MGGREGKSNEGFRRGGETRVSRWEVEKERKNTRGVRQYLKKKNKNWYFQQRKGKTIRDSGGEGRQGLADGR